MYNELKISYQRCFYSSYIYFTITLGSMAITNFKQRSFYMYRDKKRCTCNKIFIVKIAAMNPWWCTVPAACFFGWRYAHTSKKRMQWNFDTIAKMTQHLFPI